ncbi:MAG: YCF48-related protein, partial [candidate division Zixibacteria bacterium]|nr:YCF48-related protein [candidate division Zixibacteria bacterium]
MSKTAGCMKIIHAVLISGLLLGLIAGCGDDSGEAAGPIAAAAWVSRDLRLEGNQLRSSHFVNGRTGWVVGIDGAALYTSDGGATWRLQNSTTDNTLWDITFVDDKVGWAVGENATIIQTRDGGLKWVSPVTLASSADFHGVSFADGKHGWAVGGHGAIVRTIDAGWTWTAVKSGFAENLRGVQFADNAHGIAVGEVAKHFGEHRADITFKGRILITADSGKSWHMPSVNPSGEVNLWSVAFVDPQNAWIVGDSGTILKTSDGGDIWIEQTCPVEAELHDVAFATTSTGWIAGSGGTLLKTTDGGETWTPQDGATCHDLFSVSVVSTEVGWAAGTYAILRTQDGGQQWSAQSSGTSLLPTLQAISFHD